MIWGPLLCSHCSVSGMAAMHTWRAIEQHVPEGRAVQARVGGDRSERPDMILQPAWQHYVAEVSPHLLGCLLARLAALPPVPSGRLPDQLGRAQPPAHRESDESTPHGPLQRAPDNEMLMYSLLTPWGVYSPASLRSCRSRLNASMASLVIHSLTRAGYPLLLMPQIAAALGLQGGTSK